MFRQLARFFPGNLYEALPVDATAVSNAHALLAAHPYVLSHLMERAWLEHQAHCAAPLPSTASMPLRVFLNEGKGGPIDGMPLALPHVGLPYVAPWDHLIYAYFVENTRAFEIFRRAVREYVTGERLPRPADNDLVGMAWVRTAEDLWMRDNSAFPIGNLVSQVRPDFGATRRNAYYRMFGMDLNHGADDGRPYPYEKPDAANRDFVRLLESLLASVWVARVNRSNAIGVNPTDPAQIARTAKLLHELLTMRKKAGQLRREEFVIVSMMSWFHLAIEFDSPIVCQMNAIATSPGERLIRLGERVGIPAHPRTREFLELASDMSALLKLIESGMLNEVPTVPWLYGDWSPVAPVVDRIINAWELVTGRDLKAMAVRANGVTAPQLPFTSSSVGIAQRN